MQFLLVFLLTFVLQPEVDPCEQFVEVDLELCRELSDLEAEKVELLKIQQDWNNSSASARKTHYDTRIQKLQEKMVEVGNKQSLVAHLQQKLDRLVELRDVYDSQEEGSSRDEAGKLGPQISELSKLINQIRQHLGL